MRKHWYVAHMGNDTQGLVADEITGENIAVTYKKENASMVAAAPDAIALLREVLDALNELNAFDVLTDEDNPIQRKIGRFLDEIGE